MRQTFFLTFLLSIFFAGPVAAQTIEDELMIEAETAIADSEAAMQEAKEAEKVATEESRQSDIAVTKARRELENARREEAKAKREIARAERQRIRAMEETEKARIDAEAAKQASLTALDELNDLNLKLEDSKIEKGKAIEEKKRAIQAYTDVKKDLKEMGKRLSDAKKQELKVVKALRREENRLKDLQEKAKISYKSADKDRNVFLKAMASHRKTLRKISKKLDDLEIEVETDKSFYDKQKRKRLTRHLGSTVSHTNRKVAKIMTEGCNVRNFPTLSSRVLGKFSQGSKMKVRRHNRGWYSIVHNGQKAFMGAGCFQ